MRNRGNVMLTKRENAIEASTVIGFSAALNLFSLKLARKITYDPGKDRRCGILKPLQYRCIHLFL